MNRIIRLHVQSPPKPAVGRACNGCGVCCAMEPCPLGVVLSRRRRGACVALQWSDAAARYRCGVLTAPSAWLPRALRGCAPLLARWARRWIAAGVGCDCDVSVEAP
jgi:hypothetical protein